MVDVIAFEDDEKGTVYYEIKDPIKAKATYYIRPVQFNYALWEISCNHSKMPDILRDQMFSTSGLAIKAVERYFKKRKRRAKLPNAS